MVVWLGIHIHCLLNSNTSLFLPLWQSPDHWEAIGMTTLKSWHNAGIQCFKSLVNVTTEQPLSSAAAQEKFFFLSNNLIVLLNMNTLLQQSKTCLTRTSQVHWIPYWYIQTLIDVQIQVDVPFSGTPGLLTGWHWAQEVGLHFSRFFYGNPFELPQLILGVEQSHNVQKIVLQFYHHFTIYSHIAHTSWA